MIIFHNIGYSKLSTLMETKEVQYKHTDIQKKAIEKDHHLTGFIHTFNAYKHCNCCERHNYNKPFDINDNRTPNRYPVNDPKILTGPIGGVEDDDTIAFWAQFKDYTKPTFDSFIHADPKDCRCFCRHNMRQMCALNILF
tara:strand:- start:602 stop:1021 length:420 start_codon:yes stop_codon:yes gene_type:complete